MSLVSTAGGLIITKGLGGPACCSLITAVFGLVCGCTFVPPTPPSIGGGGPYNPILFTPIGQKIDNNSKIVMITVTMGEHQWKKMYAIDRDKQAIAAEVYDFFNSVQRNTNISVLDFTKVDVQITAEVKFDK